MPRPAQKSAADLKLHGLSPAAHALVAFSYFGLLL
jgi:hypothetical protein